MLAVIYLLGVAILAGQLQSRVALLEDFPGPVRYFCSLGLTLFLVNWVNFLLYVILGWGPLYLRLSWAVLLLTVLYSSGFWKPARLGPPPPRDPAGGKWNGWFIFLAVFVLARFYAGLDVDEDDNVWSVFSFVDTAFHLSVANAFLAAPHFPPMDLDMAPYPLKYHFLADFNVAHLVQVGLPALSAIWLMNVVSALAMVGTLWAVFERWLRLPSRWIMLAGLMFLFLNTALVNLIHYLVLHPRFFDPANPYYGLLRFPYFNFESMLPNMLEPQRGLLFSLPVVLLVLHAVFGGEDEPGAKSTARIRLLQAFILVCLLPLGHIVAFGVLVPCVALKLWPDRGWFFTRAGYWLPAFVLGLLQLGYLAAYGPPVNARFSSWSAATFLPLQNFAAFPAFTRGAVFWFFANGDFLFWGLLFAALALVRRARRGPAENGSARTWELLRQWRWYFAVCGLYFVLINFYRYSFDWGDSNKLVFFLNLGLTLVITLGAAQGLGRHRPLLSHALWLFFFFLCVAPSSYAFYENVLKPGHGGGTVLLFEKNGRAAAEWIDRTLPRGEIVLTAAYDDFHFLTPLAGRPTLAGIYGDSNPYRQDERQEEIRRIYANGDFQLLPKLGVRYVCISRNERSKYKLAARWSRLMEHGTGVAFQSGEGPGDYNSVYIFDTRQFAPK